MEVKVVTTKKLCTNDYYQNNWKGVQRGLTYLFDIEVTKASLLSVSFRSKYNCINIIKLIVLAPNGRVINHRKKDSTFSFLVKETGKFTIKYWMSSWCAGKEYCNDDQIYYMDIASSVPESIDIDKSNIRVYSLLGVSKEGSLYKGEMLKQICLERYLPPKNNRPIISH